MIHRHQLNEEQSFIVDNILDGESSIHDIIRFYNDMDMKDRIISISGSAGTGKSTTTAVLIKELAANYSIRMTTPTHKALAVLRNMVEDIGCNDIQATTIHSYLGLKVKENYHTGTYDLIQESNDATEPVDILFVDEASMVGEDLFDFIIREMIINTVKVVIFLGDKNQLSSVSGGESPLYLTPEKYTCYQLNTVTRQAAENKIIQIASKLSNAIDTKKFFTTEQLKDLFRQNEGVDIVIESMPKAFLSRYYNSEYDFQDNLILAHKNVTVNRYNKLARAEHLGSSIEYIIPEEKLVFNEAHFVNDEAVHRNNEIVTVARCEKITDENLDIDYWRVVDNMNKPFRIVDGKSQMDYEYELSELSKQAKKEYGAAKSELWKRFFELKNAFQNVSYTYACTTHKSQGSTCKESFIDVEEIIAMERVIGLEDVHRLLYVAFTRCSIRNILLMR